MHRSGSSEDNLKASCSSQDNLNDVELTAAASNPLQAELFTPGFMQSLESGGKREVELLRDISLALQVYANKLERTIDVQKNGTNGDSTIQDSLKSSGWSCLSNPTRWLGNQCMGWKVDENGEYHGIWRRLANAEFRKLFDGTDLDIEEVDEAIATIAFVNALIVTIPFAVAIGIPSDALDNMQLLVESCNSSSLEYHFATVYGRYRFTLALLMYSTMGCLSASVLYYIQKPKKSASSAHLTKWWKRGGRIVFVMMLLSTAVSIWALLYQSNWLLKYFTIPTDDFCNDINADYYTTGYVSTLIIFFVCFYLML